MVTPVTVFVDADNTLWDTDNVFAAAQLALLADVEIAIDRKGPSDDGLAFIRTVDQALAERHHAGLRYPPRLLAHGVAMALEGAPADYAAKLAWQGKRQNALSEVVAAEVERKYFEALGRAPPLRLGVLQGLKALELGGCAVLIVTEGSRRRVGETANKLGLLGHFTRIIEGPKRPELYRRVLKLIAARPPSFMVGDQLDRDIAPAKLAGLETIYFPGGFRPRWTPEEALVQPNYRIHSFAEVPSIVFTNIKHGRSVAG
jgi:putative hydrolase of the HAD superfamily